MIDDPRGNAYQSNGFAKTRHGATYYYNKTAESYYLNYDTPLEQDSDNRNFGPGPYEVQARYRDPDDVVSREELDDTSGVLQDIRGEFHPVTQIYNIYAKYLLLKKFQPQGQSKTGNWIDTVDKHYQNKEGKETWQSLRDYLDDTESAHDAIAGDFEKIIETLLECAKQDVLGNKKLLKVLWDQYLK
jgi:hypothetical protein